MIAETEMEFKGKENLRYDIENKVFERLQLMMKEL